MYDVHVLAESFAGARSEYNPDDTAFRQVHCRIDPGVQSGPAGM